MSVQTPAGRVMRQQFNGGCSHCCEPSEPAVAQRCSRQNPWTSRRHVSMARNSRQTMRAGPPGSAGYCNGKCCSAASGTCVHDYDTGYQDCCAYLPCHPADDLIETPSDTSSCSTVRTLAGCRCVHGGSLAASHTGPRALAHLMYKLAFRSASYSHRRGIVCCLWTQG
jgi:hypothetical protein